MNVYCARVEKLRRQILQFISEFCFLMLEKMKVDKIFYIFIMLAHLCGIIRSSSKVAIDLTRSRIIRKVPKEFMSLALDTATIRRHWGGIDWRKAIILSSGLSPAYLRVGGTSADLLLFGEIRINDTMYNSSTFDFENYEDNRAVLSDGRPKATPTNFAMTAGDLDRLYWFTKWSNLTPIFDLNALIRNEKDEWDWRANAQELLEYSQRQQYQWNFELGNEPNLYPETMNRTLSPDKLAKDYGELRFLLNERFHYYNKTKIIGPSTSNIENEKDKIYLEDFLKSGGSNYVDALTFHHYYLNGPTANEEQFVDPILMNKLIDTINVGKQLIRQYASKRSHIPLWLGETGTAYGGGTKGLTDSFIAGFLWLDKLGLSALHGLDIVVRQCIFDGNYALLDERTDPRPDYWLSLLFKRLVGSTVLQLNAVASPERISNHTRFYAHCDQNKITVFGMNLLNESIVVSFQSDQPITPFDYYLLSAETGKLLSK